MVEVFQRSSSCVEGRNGVLSLLMHRFHNLEEKTLRVLSIVHNFGVQRTDGTTAAERFFESKHSDLFEYLVTNVRIPARPKRQHHDLQKRPIARKNRHVAQKFDRICERGLSFKTSNLCKSLLLITIRSSIYCPPLITNNFQVPKTGHFYLMESGHF